MRLLSVSRPSKSGSVPSGWRGLRRRASSTARLNTCRERDVSPSSKVALGVQSLGAHSIANLPSLRLKTGALPVSMDAMTQHTNTSEAGSGSADPDGYYTVSEWPTC